MTDPYISVVAPLYNEKDSVAPLYKSITDSLDSLGLSYEIIFVDDGSSDETYSRAAKLARSDPRLKLVRFRRNAGQTAAMSAGIDFSSGSIIVTMDGDLQNDPRDVGRLIRRIEQGADLAVGWRHKRKDHFFRRTLPSKIANWIIGKVTGVPIKDNGCSLKAYRASVIKTIPLYSEMHRFIPAMSTLAGARVDQVKVRHHPRKYGESKYGLSRIYKVLFDLIAIKTITAYSSRSLKWFSMIALPFLLVSLISGIWAAMRGVYFGESLVVPAGVSIIFLGGGAFLILCGILSEHIYMTGETRPVTSFKLASAVNQQEVDSQ